VIDRDLFEGWDGLLLHLTNGESLDLGELPMVCETEDGCPIFGLCFVDGVCAVEGWRVGWRSGQRCRNSRVVKHPKETRKVVDRSHHRGRTGQHPNPPGRSRVPYPASCFRNTGDSRSKKWLLPATLLAKPARFCSSGRRYDLWTRKSTFSTWICERLG
jgi:hypothetical protein